MPTGVLGVAAATITVAPSPPDTVRVSVEAAMCQVGADARALLWWSRLDQTVAPVEVELTIANIEARPQLALTLHAVQEPDAVVLGITIAMAADKGSAVRTVTHSVRLRGTDPHADLTGVEARFDFPKLTSVALATIGGRPRLLVGDADGNLLDVDAVTGAQPRTLRHATAPRHIASADSPLGPLVVVTEATTTVWDANRGVAIRKLPASFATAIARPIALGQGLALVAADGGAAPLVRLFNLRTAPVVPPDFCLVSPLDGLFDDFNVDCTLSDGTVASLNFTPELVFDDRTDPDKVHATPLRYIFEDLGVAPGTHLRLWRYNPDPPPGLTLDLAWDTATRVRLSWRCRVGPEVIEASLFEPLPEKQLAPRPFSASAARLAAVVLADSQGAAPAPLFQRTAFFGDAATTRPSLPAILPGAAGFDFAMTIRDRGTFDQPMPTTPATLHVLLVKYLSLGQVIAAGATPT